MKEIFRKGKNGIGHINEAVFRDAKNDLCEPYCKNSLLTYQRIKKRISTENGLT
jgi:hypothetical protein